MNKGPVLIVIDEKWEKELYTIIWEDLECDNDLQVFDSAEEAMSFILEAEIGPLLIVSDINLPGINGFEFKELLSREEHLKCKYVPFVFRSTIDLDEQISRAYELGAGGYFIKGSGVDEMRKNITAMINYWRSSQLPTAK